jgi:hypothetical protein
MYISNLYGEIMVAILRYISVQFMLCDSNSNETHQYCIDKTEY